MPSPNRSARAPRVLPFLFSLTFTLLAVHGSHATPSWVTQVPPEKLLQFQPRSADDFARFAQEVGLDASARRAGSIAAAEPASALTGVGLWREWGPPVRAGHTIVFDTRRHREILLGGLGVYDPQGTVWMRSLPGGQWAPLTHLPWVVTSADGLGAELGAVYDSVGDRLVVLHADGQFELDALPLGAAPVWSHLWTGPSTANGALAGFALDSQRNAVVLLGVWDSAASAHRVIRVPLADPTGWISMLTSGAQPAPTRSGVAVYDETRDAYDVLFDPSASSITGGTALYSTPAGGTMAWTAIPLPGFPSGSPRRMVRDAATDRLILVDETCAALGVSMTGGAWQWLTARGPGSRYDAAVAFDPVTRHLVLDGGTWQPSLSQPSTFAPLAYGASVDSGVAWTQVQPMTGPAAWTPEGDPGLGSRIWHEVVLDPIGDQLVAYGGAGWFGDPGFTAVRALNETGGWRAQGTGSDSLPRRRFAQQVVFDPEHHALLLYGGQATDGTGDMLADLWSLSLDPGGHWTRLSAPGGPGVRRNASLCYDASRHRFVLAGGDDLHDYFYDAWELKLDPTPTWRALSVTGAVPAYPNLVADPAVGDAWCAFYGPVMLRHVTVTDDGLAYEDVPAIGSEALLGRTPALAGFDPSQHRLLWLGTGSNTSNVNLGQIWTTTLGATATWQTSSISGITPTWRSLMGSLYDANGHRLVMVGGYQDNGAYFGDTWSLDLADLPTATQVSLAQSTSDAAGVTLRWIVAGGAASAEVERSDDGQAWCFAGDAVREGQEAWRFTGAPLAAGARAAYRLVVHDGASSLTSAAAWLDGPASTRAGLALAPISNPVRGAVSMRFTLPNAAPATLRLLDVSGRVVGEEHVPAGAVAWTFASRPAAGLYFAEIAQGAERRTARVVLLGGR